MRSGGRDLEVEISVNHHPGLKKQNQNQQQNPKSFWTQVPEIRFQGALASACFAPALGGSTRDLRCPSVGPRVWTPESLGGPREVKVRGHNAKGTLTLLGPLPAG